MKGFVEKNAIMEKTFLVVVPFYPASAIAVDKKRPRELFSFFGKKKNARGEAAKNAEEAEHDRSSENLAQLNQRDEPGNERPPGHRP